MSEQHESDGVVGRRGSAPVPRGRADTPDAPHLTVAVLTYRRNAYLAELVHAARASRAA